MSDDLGSFFAEIQSIEEVVSTDECVAAAAGNENQAVFFTNDILIMSPERERPQTQIISKPAEIVVKAETRVSHPVYTYNYADLDNSNAKGALTSSSASTDPYAHYTTVPQPQLSLNNTSYSNMSNTVPNAPVPLPSVPRQDKKFVRAAADEVWVDDTLNEWPENDYRIFVGDLGKEIGTEHLAKHFQQYKSFAKAKVIRTKHENKARGFGFVSFLDPMDCAKAIREQNGKYLGSRPMKITKSSWKERDIKEVKKKENKKRKLQESLGLA